MKRMVMKKSGYTFCLTIVLSIIGIIIGITGCSTKNSKKEDVLTVAVTIVPQETFVKAVAGDLAEVVTMVPPGRSPESYAPTPKELQKFSDASIYFTIGISTEEVNILPRTQDINKNLKVVSLADEVAKVYPDREFAPGSRDPHTWLSPKRAIVMIRTIARELSAIDPENSGTYEKNANAYIAEIEKADSEIAELLKDLKSRTFIIYHPAFGYFADDYGLNMLALEEEGKEATARDLQKVIDVAKAENIKVVFYQAEDESKKSKAFAEEIGGIAELINPLAADYIENLKKVANMFKELL